MRDWKRRIGTILLALLMVWTSVNWSMETNAENSISVSVKYVDEKNQTIYQDDTLCSVDGSIFRYEIPGSDRFQSYLDGLSDEKMMCMYMTREDDMPGVAHVYWDRDNDEGDVELDLLSGEIQVGPGDQLVFALDDSDGIPAPVKATIHLSSMDSEIGVEVTYYSKWKQGEIEFDSSPVEYKKIYHRRKYIHQTEFDIPLAKDEDISKSEGYEHIKVLKWMLINEDDGIEESYNSGGQYHISLGDAESVGVSFDPVLGQTITTKFVDENGKTIEGVEEVSKDVEIGATYSTPAKEIPGYTLIGESDNEEKTMGAEKVETVIYRYHLDTYGISYDLAGGTLVEGETNPTSYNIHTTTFTLKNPAREGYTFKGWTDSNGTTPSTSVSVAKGTTGELKFTAVWEEIKIVDEEKTEKPENVENALVNEQVEEVIETVATQIRYGIQRLTRGTKYSFAAGTTYKVSGDETIYTGGNDFYVSSDGEYEFTMVEE